MLATQRSDVTIVIPVVIATAVCIQLKNNQGRKVVRVVTTGGDDGVCRGLTVRLCLNR